MGTSNPYRVSQIQTPFEFCFGGKSKDEIKTNVQDVPDLEFDLIQNVEINSD